MQGLCGLALLSSSGREELGQAGCRMREIVGERAAAGGFLQLSPKAEEEKPGNISCPLSDRTTEDREPGHYSLPASLPFLRRADQGEGSLQRGHSRSANHRCQSLASSAMLPVVTRGLAWVRNAGVIEGFGDVLNGHLREAFWDHSPSLYSP